MCLRWLPRDECLKNGSNARSRRIAVANFFQHPITATHAQHHVCDGSRALFRDKKMHFARTSRAKACEQPLLRNRVLNKIRIAVQVKPERRRAHATHRGDRGEVAVVASAHVRCRRAPDRRRGHLNDRL